MSLLVDWQIRQLSKDARLLEPYSEAVSGNGVVSSGLTHAGYDLRLSPEGVLLFREESWWERVWNWVRRTPRVVDPRRFKEEAYRKDIFTEVTPQNGVIVIPPRGYILGRSVEYIRMPRNLSGTCVGKSTLARSGILINTTPLEPGWEGYLTIEISNICPIPALVLPDQGIAQLRFEHLISLPEKDYADKGGKYQGQTETTPARVL